MTDTLTAPISRIVAPGTTRLALSGGDWLIVKTKLNAGETLDLFAAAAPDLDITQGAALALAKLAPAKVGLAIMTAYLLDWSLTDLEGAIIPIRGASDADKAAAIRLLEFDAMIEIMNAVSAHDTAARQEKKRPAAALGS